MKENRLYKIIAYIHVAFVSSMTFLIASVLSLGILFIPALSTLMETAQLIINDEFDIFDNLIKKFFKTTISKMNYKILILYVFVVLNVFNFVMILEGENYYLKVTLFSFLSLTFTYLIYATYYIIENDQFDPVLNLVIMLSDIKSLVVIFIFSTVFIISHFSPNLMLFNYTLISVYIYCVTLILIRVFAQGENKLETNL